MDLPSTARNLSQPSESMPGNQQVGLLRKSLMLLSGSVVSQIIPFAFLPILARLYSPERFADLNLFMLVATILYTVGTARFDLALMLPRNPRRALNLMQLGIWGCSVVAVLTLILLLINPFSFLSALGSEWLLLPLAILITGSCELLSYMHNRAEAYRTLSTGLVGMQLATALSKLLLNMKASGLILGHCLGRFFWFVYLLFNSQFSILKLLKPPPYKYARALIRRYLDFPRYNVPHSILSAFSGGFLVLFLSLYSENKVAGYVSFSRTLLFAPIGMLSASVGRVFFKEAAV